MNTLLMMHSLIKSSIVDFHRGKEEILSMDDELPLFILVTAKSNYPHFIADLNMVGDFIKDDPNVFEPE